MPKMKTHRGSLNVSKRLDQANLSVLTLTQAIYLLTNLLSKSVSFAKLAL